MAFDPIVYDNPDALWPSYKTTAGEAYLKGQLLKYGVDNDTVTNVTVANDGALIAVCMEDIPSTESGPTRRVQTRLLVGGAIIPMRVGAAVTLGTKVVCQGTTGKIADIGAAAVGDARALIGTAHGASAVVNDLVPVALK
jgi:hypothetical protein